MDYDTNPFPETDADRRALWDMLVGRDIRAFLAADWSMVAGDFIEEGFMGIDSRRSDNPDSWRLAFPSLFEYREEWLRQAEDFKDAAWAEDPERALFEATTLRDIEIQKDSALLHKKFDGGLTRKNGTHVRLNWQTLYRCRRLGKAWKIAGFTGYMPHPMGNRKPADRPAIQLPADAGQHVSAGPYSPVLLVDPGRLVVISGQASIDRSGDIIGDTIEEQTRWTMENCRRQLATAGCTFKDVFKVNVYLTDLSNWPRFNRVYETYFPEPRPVRTAVGTELLSTLLVEVEMWAALGYR